MQEIPVHKVDTPEASSEGKLEHGFSTKKRIEPISRLRVGIQSRLSSGVFHDKNVDGLDADNFELSGLRQ
jgi:hypothetical protein